MTNTPGSTVGPSRQLLGLPSTPTPSRTSSRVAATRRAMMLSCLDRMLRLSSQPVSSHSPGLTPHMAQSPRQSLSAKLASTHLALMVFLTQPKSLSSDHCFPLTLVQSARLTQCASTRPAACTSEGNLPPRCLHYIRVKPAARLSPAIALRIPLLPKQPRRSNDCKLPGRSLCSHTSLNGSTIHHHALKLHEMALQYTNMPSNFNKWLHNTPPCPQTI